jgi:hypothetical protein
MPGWGDILKEIQQSAENRGQLGPDLDGIRLKYIQKHHNHTGRAVIVYASGWLRSSGEQNVEFLVNSSDMLGFMECCHGVADRKLDLVIHSPGGSGIAAEQIIKYLRTQFDHIRAFVPLQAKSAATMMALGCDEIIMGAHSELGPIDPQIVMPIPGGQRFAPAHAIVRDFQKAREEISKDVTALPVWTPILHAYAGGLLTFCEQQIGLAQDVVAGWLSQYMLAHPDSGVPEDQREQRSREIAEWFGSNDAYDRFREHGRPIRIEDLQTLPGMVVRPLEDDHDLQDIVLSTFHAMDFALGGAAIKVIENHLGKRYVKVQQQIVINSPSQPIPEPTGPNLPKPNQSKPNQLPRSERRKQGRR